MTTYHPDTILQEMENLIAYSCQFRPSSEKKFNTLHSALIKKHFGAFEVELDSKAKKIHLKILVEEARYTHVTFEYNDLKTFLKSCLEDDLGSLSFYQNMLTFYNVGAA